MKTIKDRVVWLTGASSGIGEALAYQLSREGAKLVLSARRIAELERVAKSCHLDHADVYVMPLDLENQSDFETAKNKVLQKFGRIDVLINNGGVSQRSLAKDTAMEVDRKLFEVNYFGTIALTKIVLPVFLSQKEGMIVTVTSAVGKFGSPWRSGYAATKHALHGFFDSLRAEVHSDNIKVLLVCPGFIQTNVSVNALTATGQRLGSMDTATANGLTSEECARQICTAIIAEKEEVITAKFRERFAIWLKRFFPSVFSIVIRKMAVR